MKRLTLPILLTTLLVASSYSQVYAFPDSIKKVEFWAPPVMLEGYEYDVIVVLVGYNAEETRFDILSNNENIVGVIDREITIEPFKSHGVAKVKANSAGKVDLFAVSGDELLTTSAEVVEPALMPAKLDIVLPSNRVAVNQIPAYVFLVDAFNNPLQATEDIEVNVSSFGNVYAQVSKTVIKKDTHYSKFIIDVKGDGGVTAATNNLQPDTEMLEFASVSDDVELKVEVAPDPLATSSSGEVYVWLEKDGKPFVPERNVKVTLVSEDSRFLAFSKAVQFSAPLDRDLVSTAEIFIKGGESYTHTMVWTTDFLIKNQQQNQQANQTTTNNEDEEEEIIITAIADGFDSAETTVEIRKPVKNDPNFTRIFAFPDPAIDKLDIIVALYFIEETDEEDEDEQESDRQTTIDEEEEEQLCAEEALTGEDEEQLDQDRERDEDEEEDEETECSLEPVAISESIVAHVSTDSLLRAAYDRVRLDKDDLDIRDHYTVIPARTLGMPGTSKIFGAADGTRGEKIEIRIEKPHSSIPTIAVKPLPVLANAEQDMFLIYSVKDGAITDLKIKNPVVSTKPAIEIVNIHDISSINVVNGRSSDLVSGRIVDVTALAQGFVGTATTVTPFNPELRNIVAYHPPTVHAGEPFPVVFYATDQNKHPIEIVEPSISPKTDMVKMLGSSFMLSSSSEHSFVFYTKSMNPGISKIESFSYDIALDASVGDEQFDFGDDITLTYQVIPADARVTLDTDLPFERNENGFTIESTIPGSHTLLLTAEKEGFKSTSKEIQIEITDTFAAGFGAGTSESSKKFDSDMLLKPNSTTLLAYVGILIAIAGGAFYIFAKKKLKRSPNVASEEELTYLFRGCSDKWTLILLQ